MPERFRVELAPSQSITAIKSPRLDLCTRTVLERQEGPMVRFLQRRVYCEPVLPVLCFMCGPDEEAVRRSGRATAAGPCGDDADGQHLARRVEINAPHVPRFGNAEGGFKQLVLHPQLLLPWLNAALWRIQPGSILGARGRRQGFASPGFARP
jgi:hypothetical protein